MELTQLGNKVAIPPSPDDATIECIPWDGDDIFCRFSTPEFTSLCPKTGQPDFAKVVIDYVPATGLIESKSLKLFLHSFRNHGAFHEQVTNEIGSRLYDAAKPVWMRVCAIFEPRGGIPIDVVWEKGEFPDSMTWREVNLPSYTGRS